MVLGTIKEYVFPTKEKTANFKGSLSHYECVSKKRIDENRNNRRMKQSRR